VAKPLGAAGRDFAQRLGKMSTAIQNGKRDTLTEAAMVAKKAHLAVIQRDAGGDLKLSRVGKRGAKVGARYDISGDRAEIKATGPLHFLANPMSPHRIPKARRRGRRRVVVVPGLSVRQGDKGIRAWVQHPGTRGKDTWNKGIDNARPKVSKVMRSQMANVVKRGFG
jgi:hypothetical protein